uniref:DUF2237 domain-containing protein n=1 Tax=Chromera velia CCMP2878 TaxID=1169474 RepID=A0A0G4GZB3_9ALVE|mmetsp:Transcript_17416/g.35381  ORF Transcript_17416/g.35381 Transcript_17416/m.35381 type:complete len:186 (-) Transcript_17416:383-940(-)|eukprot:Cvel_5432.t1-p1 / transcript=Cvel_5432.t1 / gene=Cvel_5432 / organism=Chromera_velia_CCMP2878 / gene_product=hypothetical protein / transcript_product=hypothetical protein / location=Cvel_scaffold253:39083-41506(-) / protein_length=185 / sequence_SO=supercontig / SO=protein_coding / is_pseudo=false
MVGRLSLFLVANRLLNVSAFSPGSLARLQSHLLFQSTQTTVRVGSRRLRFFSMMNGHAPQANGNVPRNVLGGPLQPCCVEPYKTGWYRDGFCNTDAMDFGVHTVCAVVTDEFLNFTRARGNDLSTPHPPSFPGLKAGDKWCLCAGRWKEAAEAGCAPFVLLEATHIKTLETVPLDMLQRFAAPSQ